MLSTRSRIIAALIVLFALVIVATGCTPAEESKVTSQCDHGNRVYSSGDGDGLAVVANDPSCDSD